jgi:hypothetical protein
MPHKGTAGFKPAASDQFRHPGARPGYRAPSDYVAQWPSHYVAQ